MSDEQMRVMMIWPYGIQGAESIPMSFSFLVPQIRQVAHIQIMDCSLFNIHPRSDVFEHHLLEACPHVIGISSWSQNWRWVGMTIQRIREILPNTVVILGGPHVSATGDVGKANLSLMGEAEHTFPALLRQLANGTPLEQMTDLDGLCYIGQPQRPAPALIADLDGLGMPDYDAMLLPQYQMAGYQYRTGQRKQAPVLATRGCPYICAFCEAPMLSGRKIRKHSVPYLKELLLKLKNEYGVSHVNIVDDNFTFHKDYCKSFCEMVLSSRAELGEMTFATPNGLRVERSDSEMFQLMKRAGWSRVIFAPESGSQRMVDIMAKHLDLGVIPGRVEMAHAAGLEVEAFFIMNYPGETWEDVEATRQFIERIPFDDISLHIFKPLPHTPIWRDLVESGALAPEYVVGRYDEIDWLANGLKIEDIRKMIELYSAVAKSVFRVA